jgi:phosphoribosylaminoimidazole carboxylase (NCAIR synthetase)
MLDELQNLLEQQLELARQGNSTGKQIEILGKRADCLVKKITQTEFLELPEYEKQKKKLKRLYKVLHITIEAQKAETSQKLSQVRNGKKIVGTYRSNI